MTIRVCDNIWFQPVFRIAAAAKCRWSRMFWQDTLSWVVKTRCDWCNNRARNIHEYDEAATTMPPLALCNACSTKERTRDR